jgi:hypothetical protein
LFWFGERPVFFSPSAFRLADFSPLFPSVYFSLVNAAVSRTAPLRPHACTYGYELLLLPKQFVYVRFCTPKRHGVLPLTQIINAKRRDLLANRVSYF